MNLATHIMETLKAQGFDPFEGYGRVQRTGFNYKGLKGLHLQLWTHSDDYDDLVIHQTEEGVYEIYKRPYSQHYTQLVADNILEDNLFQTFQKYYQPDTNKGV